MSIDVSQFHQVFFEKSFQGLSGATIMGDGSVALILDVTGVMELQRAPEFIQRIDSDYAA